MCVCVCECACVCFKMLYYNICQVFIDVRKHTTMNIPIGFCICAYACVCVRVCVCERERESVCVCVCVCVVVSLPISIIACQRFWIETTRTLVQYLHCIQPRFFIGRLTGVLSNPPDRYTLLLRNSLDHAPAKQYVHSMDV